MHVAVVVHTSRGSQDNDPDARGEIRVLVVDAAVDRNDDVMRGGGKADQAPRALIRVSPHKLLPTQAGSFGDPDAATCRTKFGCA